MGHFCLLCFTLGKGYLALHTVASSVVTTHSCVVTKPLLINRRTENGSQTLWSHWVNDMHAFGINI